MKIAAVGDLHHDGTSSEAIHAVLGELPGADALVLCGDLTTHGEPDQTRSLARILDDVEVPVVSVLGNHDFEAGAADENCRILSEAGVRVLDGGIARVGDVGFAGVKGFPGGFGRGLLNAFGEPQVKAFVQAAVDEALKLENALRNLRTPVRVVVLHYAPFEETLEGEPKEIFPFLGCSRLLPPIDALGADVVFHGHAHTGARRGTTPAGIPVFNVSLPLLRSRGRAVFLWETPEPDDQPE